jgi:hypothetical protein
MHFEQKVCAQDVSIGVSKNSLQIWQRNKFSRLAKPESGVFSQSLESGTSYAPVSMTNV